MVWLLSIANSFKYGSIWHQSSEVTEQSIGHQEWFYALSPNKRQVCYVRDILDPYGSYMTPTSALRL